MTMIINSVAYQMGARLGDITIDDISEVVKQAETFVWLGLHEPDDALLLKIQEEFSLHELSIEDARHAHQRPKIETYGDSMFIVLKTAQLEQGKVVYGETHLFVGSNFPSSPSSRRTSTRSRRTSSRASSTNWPSSGCTT
jgi:magnesium transporter